MSSFASSNIGLFLCAIPALVHGPEALFPTYSRYLANFVFPACGFTLPMDIAKMLSYSDQMKMLQAAIAVAPVEKEIAAKDLLFAMLFESRQGAAGFLAAAITSYYASTLRLAQRHPVHLMFTVLSIIMCLANANHVGFPWFGEHPLVTDNGWWLGFCFAPFWAAAAYFNYKAFTLSIAASKVDKKKKT